MIQVRQDNSYLDTKLALRRYFLNKYHQGKPLYVLDAFQGAGIIWSRLKEEFSVTSYWGLDIIPHKGRLKLKSERVLIQRDWRENVVDLDSYGSPWAHWLALLEACDHSVNGIYHLWIKLAAAEQSF